MIDVETLRSRLRLDASGFTSGLSGATRSLNGFGQRMSSAGRGILDFGSKLGLTVLGLRELAGVAKGAFNALFGGNIAIENVRAQLVAFTGSAEEAEKVLAQIRTEAAKTPFSFNEMAAATASLVPASKQSGVALMDLVKQAEILAAVNPAEGLEGAAFSLREALSGDFTSIIERFNLPRQRLNELKAEGVPALEAIQIALKEMGIDASIVSNMANTATGRWSTFIDTLNTIKDTAMQKTFEMLSGALVPMQAWLDANNERLTAFAELVGERLAKALARLGHWLRENRDEMLRLAKIVLTVVVSGFRIFRGLLDFVRRHASLLAPIVVGLVASFLLFYKVIPAVKGVITTIKALRAAMLAMNPWFLIIAAAVALLYLAWTQNWFGIREKTRAAIQFVGKWLGKLWEFIQPAIDVIRLLGRYWQAVANHDIEPGNLEGIPDWLKPIAFVIGRVVKSIRVFIVTWQKLGALAAFKTIPAQIRAFGRAVAGLLNSVGLQRFGAAFKQSFYALSRVVQDVISLVDNLIHGRWGAAWRDLKQLAVDAVKLVLTNLKLLPSLLADIFNLIPWSTIGAALWTGFQVAIGFLVASGIPWALEQGGILLGKLWEGMQWVWENTIIPALEAMPQQLVDLLTLGWDLLYAVGNLLVAALSEGITFGWNWLIGWFKDLPGVLLSPFADIYWAFWNIGWSIIAGMSAGIQSIWNTLVGWIDAIMDQFNRVPDFLKPGSPSKTATYWAESVGTGLAKGLRKTIGKVRAAVGDVAATLDLSSQGAGMMTAMAGVSSLATAAPGSFTTRPPAGASAMTGGERPITIHTVVVNNPVNGDEVVSEILRAVKRKRAGQA